MIPKSLSATSVQVWEMCPARWVAENFNKAGQESGVAASRGTACHSTLEWWVVSGSYLLDLPMVEQKALIQQRLLVDYTGLFGEDTSQLADCTEMVQRWVERQDWTGRTVLSAEVKDFFEIKSTAGGIKFNYVWDRCDRLDTGEIEVVDYKTLIKPISPAGLKDKIQARCYGLAAQIKYPEAQRIWVTFDMLRYDPVGIVFTRDENIATWKYLKRKANEIVAMPEDEAPENLNPECRWCIRKTKCASLVQHAKVGGVLALDDPQKAAQQRADLECARSGLEAAIGELDTFLLRYAEKSDTKTFEAGDLDVIIDVGKRRNVDLNRVLKIVAPDVVARFGNLTMKAFDAMLKSSEITPEQKRQLRGLIEMKYGEPRIKTERRNPIDGDD